MVWKIYLIKLKIVFIFKKLYNYAFKKINNFNITSYSLT